MRILITFLLICAIPPLSANAGGGNQQRFLDKAFDGRQPTLQTLWLKADLKSTLKSNFDYQLNRLRLRYWTLEHRSAWVLEEIGKERPITVGIVVEENKIHSIKVLRYRETRGGEVQYPFFSDQFHGLALKSHGKKYKLTEHIDGITGATLSVKAMEKVAKVALYLHQSIYPKIIDEQTLISAQP